MKPRNTSFDCFKGIACLGIVLMHRGFPGQAGRDIRTIACFGVPFFFCISGYYLSSKDIIEPSEILRKIRHIIILIFGSEIFYSAFAFFHNGLMDPYRRAAFIEESFQKGWIERYFIMGQTPVYRHLWFLYALFTLYLLVLIFARTRKSILIVALLSVPILLLCIMLLEEFQDTGIIKNSFHLLASETEFYKSNSFLFRAAPFFLLGFLFYEYREKVQKLNMPLSALVVGIVAFLGMAVVEGRIFHKAQFYVGNIVALFLIMILCIKHPDLKIQPFCYIGAHFATLVYIYHFAIIHFLDKIYTKAHLSGNLLYGIRPIIVILITLFVSWIHINVKKKILQ